MLLVYLCVARNFNILYNLCNTLGRMLGGEKEKDDVCVNCSFLCAMNMASPRRYFKKLSICKYKLLNKSFIFVRYASGVSLRSLENKEFSIYCSYDALGRMLCRGEIKIVVYI